MAFYGNSTIEGHCSLIYALSFPTISFVGFVSTLRLPSLFPFGVISLFFRLWLVFFFVSQLLDDVVIIIQILSGHAQDFHIIHMVPDFILFHII